MEEELGAYNAKRRKKGLPAVRVRIGIHSGDAIAGNIGAPGRVNYTLVGDTVNQAQRLEALGKDYIGEEDVIVLLSSETAGRINPDAFEIKALGEVTLRGRRSSTSFYNLGCHPAQPSGDGTSHG